MSPPSPLKGALIGCGFVSQYHLDAWKRLPDAAILAVCDTNPDRLAQAGVRAPAARRYTDAEAMFEHETYDFVEICTRPDTHLELVGMAARHGTHVLCQKPAALVRSELLAMIEACDRAGVRFMVHENWRFRPWYRALRAEIEAGTVGRPVRLRLAHRDTRALRPDGFVDQPFLAEMPRLILMEMGCHLIDTARYLFGEVRSVAATVGRFGQRSRGEDVATLSVSFDGGALGLLDMSWCAAFDPHLVRPEWALNETVVEGTAGALKLQTDGSLLFVDLSGRTERRPVPMPPDVEVYLSGYLAAQTHFIEGLVHDQPHETSGLDTLRTMDVVWAAYRSAEEGTTVVL
jgi:predicted dehydrogenase